MVVVGNIHVSHIYRFTKINRPPGLFRANVARTCNCTQVVVNSKGSHPFPERAALNCVFQLCHVRLVRFLCMQSTTRRNNYGQCAFANILRPFYAKPVQSSVIPPFPSSLTSVLSPFPGFLPDFLSSISPSPFLSCPSFLFPPLPRSGPLKSV